MRQLREAPCRDTVREIEKRIEESGRERGRELREAMRLRWDGFVDWGVPGAGEWGEELEVEPSLGFSFLGEEKEQRKAD